MSDIDEDSVRSCLARGCEEAQFVAFIETDHCTNVFLADKLRKRAESRKDSRRSPSFLPPRRAFAVEELPE